MITGRLHDSSFGRCTCSQCVALESTAVIVAELLRPGESREIGIEGTGLFLTIKRHRMRSFSPRPGRSSLGAGFRQGANIAQTGRGGIHFSLKR